MTLPLPKRVAKQLLDQAKALDGEILRVLARVRTDANAPARSFMGELFVLQEIAYRVGREVGMNTPRRQKRIQRQTGGEAARS